MDTLELMVYSEEDYYALPTDRKAELIEGFLYDMASPSLTHQRLSRRISRSIEDYIHERNGACEVLEAMDVKPFTDRKDTIVEPDILVVCDPKKLTERRVEGAPDWIIEITSPGNPQNDYLRKLDIYYRAGVKEYWIVDPEKETVFVYYFADMQFSLTSYHFTDKIPSQLYEGFTICPAELLGE